MVGATEFDLGGTPLGGTPSTTTTPPIRGISLEIQANWNHKSTFSKCPGRAPVTAGFSPNKKTPAYADVQELNEQTISD